MKKIILFIFIFIIIGTAVIAVEYPFNDLEIQEYDKYGKPLRDENGNNVTKPHYALREINMLTKIGLINGYEDGSFKPENTITKAEYIKMVMIMATNRTFNFNSIPAELEHWGSKYLAVAEMQGVVERGKYKESDLDEPITRIEMVCILSNIQIKMKNISQNRDGKLQYTDIASLSAKEKELLLHAAKYVLLEGMLDTNKFEPNKNLTRAEATVSIMRVY